MGAPASLCGNCANLTNVMRANLVHTGCHGTSCPFHGFLIDHALGIDPLTEPYDTRKCIDHPITCALFLGHKQATIIGAQIQGSNNFVMFTTDHMVAILVFVNHGTWPPTGSKPAGDFSLSLIRNSKYLTWEYQVWIINAIPVGLINQGIENTITIETLGKTPQMVTLLNCY